MAKWLQKALQDLGLYDGKIDGIIGPATFAAIIRYYQASVYAPGLSVQLARIEQNQRDIMRVLLRTEGEVIMAYEAELDAAEAAAKANADQEDSAENVFKVLTDLVAALKTGQTDPATAARIVSLTTALNDRAARLAAAIANTPTT